MKKLPLPNYIDITIISKLANNKRLHATSYPHLFNNLDLIKSQYKHYIDNAGNALNISKQNIPNILKKALSKNFNTEPDDLNHLTILRNSSPDSCPMCGSNHSGTLDHVFPREDYPEWTVFSWNLVPACGCNSKRKRKLIGRHSANERILHPYFDNEMSNRNISCTIIPINGYRIVNITINCIATGSNLNAIKFHIKEVVEKAGIVNWLEKQWIKIYQEPTIVIQTLDENTILNNIIELDQLLSKFLNRLDKRHQTPNNWESVLIYGILQDPNAKQFIIDHHNNIVRGITIPEDN